MSNLDLKDSLIKTAKWTVLLFIVGILVAAVLPFPYWVIALATIIIGMTLALGTLMARNWITAVATDNDLVDKVEVKYYCLKCGINHNESSCPNCGSRIKRAVF